MKIIRKSILIFVSLLIFSSCVRVETIIRVNKDGSGTISETVMMSKVFADMMRSFSESFSDLGGDNEQEKEPFSLFDEEKLLKEAGDFGEGVKYRSGKEVTEKDWEGYTAVYAFDDISKIKLNTSQEDKVDTGMDGSPTDESEDVEQEEKEFYYFSFERGKNPTLIINRTEIEDQYEKMEESEDEDADGELDVNGMNDEMLSMFTGMRFTMKVEVDGKIVNTNASYKDGSAITLMDMDMGEMMKNKEAFAELTSNKPENTEEMKVFMEKFDGLKLELEKPVTIRFR